MTSDKKIWEKNRQSLEKGFAAINRERTIANKLQLSQYVASFAVVGGHGYYSSDIIEHCLVELGEKIPTPEGYVQEPGTCLVVMGRTYEVGGHTRVVERWIEADFARKYSIVFIRDDAPTPPRRLTEAVEKSGGTFYTLKK